MTTWRSIRSHHTPASLHRADFVPISPHSHFRDQLGAIGRRMEAAAPQPFSELQTCTDVAGLVAAEERLCTDPGYLVAYRDRFAYHPFHAFSMAYFGGLTRERAAAVYLAGALNPGYARGMGAIPTGTVDEALGHARRYVGADPRMIVVPELSKPGYHLRSV